MDQALKDWIQAISWVAAILVGAFGIAKVVIELRSSRSQRENDLRWKMVQAAKGLNDEMLENSGALAAMVMLDWENRSFEVAPGKSVTVTRAEVLRALRTKDLGFTQTEVFIRDSFDELFYHLSLFEHYTDRKFIDFGDIRFPVEYYVAKMVADSQIYVEYMREYRFARARAFLDRFEEWKSERTAA